MSDEAFLEAIKAGDLQEIKRLHQGGHLECLHENGCPWDEWACRAAAEGGQLECLKYLHENGCPWDEWACRAAALRGHLECLKYLHENGCPWNAWTCRAAAEGGHLLSRRLIHSLYDHQRRNLECLKYLHENGCPWNSYCFDAAITSRDLGCVKYCHENQCPWNGETLYYAACMIPNCPEIFQCLEDMFLERIVDDRIDTTTDTVARARGNSRRERMRQSVRNVQVLLDQNKQKLPEGDYLTAANSMLDIYKLTKKADDEEDYDT